MMLIIKIPPVNKRFQRMLESIAINSSKRHRNTNIITVLDMYGKHAIAEVILNRIPEYAKDKSLFEMGLSQSYSLNLLSIKRGKRIIDVTKAAMLIRSQTYSAFVPLIGVALIYLVIVLVLQYLVGRLERRLNNAYR